jgi:hypothetical protein
MNSSMAAIAPSLAVLVTYFTSRLFAICAIDPLGSGGTAPHVACSKHGPRARVAAEELT